LKASKGNKQLFPPFVVVVVAVVADVVVTVEQVMKQSFEVDQFFKVIHYLVALLVGVLRRTLKPNCHFILREKSSFPICFVSTSKCVCVR